MQKKTRPSINSIQSEELLTDTVADTAIPADILDQDALRSISGELEKHFPQPIEETELVLMEISPHRLHAYWHIPPWDLETANAKTDEKKTQLVIRFHDLTAEGPQSMPPPAFDIEISKTTGSQYVEVWEDAKRYAAELGLRTKDGLLVDLARSNTVELPSAGHSTSLGAKVMTLTPLDEELYLEPPANQSEFDAISSRKNQTWELDESQPIDLTLESRLSKLLPNFPHADLSFADALTKEKPFQTDFEDEISEEQSREIPPSLKERSLTSAENTHQTPDIFDSFPLCQIQDVQEKPIAKEIISLAPLHSLDEAAAQLPAGTSLKSLAQISNVTQFPQQVSTAPSSDTRYASGPTPISSFAFGDLEGKEDELHMELTIRGRKQPNSQFVFYGVPIPTRADGSFYLSKVLPARTAKLVAQLLAASLEE